MLCSRAAWGVRQRDRTKVLDNLKRGIILGLSLTVIASQE
jgi:hypothetical protein